MHAPTQHDSLIYAMYPTATLQPTTTATQLDNHHRATLAPPSTHRLRRVFAAALPGVRSPIA